MGIQHPIPPEFDEKSEILILGSFPSVKSREQQFFYGHERNRFWRVCAAVFDCPVPVSVAEKRRFLHGNHIALWDVIASCDITGSADASIQNVQPNDLSLILQAAPIRTIYLNGKTAEKYYKKFCQNHISIPAVCLPSTSPANAAWSEEKLIEAWRQMRR